MEWSEDFYSLGLVVLAGALGAVMGLEREICDKPAGLRTHMFVCAGAALLILLGDAVLENFQKEGHYSYLQSDPIRVIQAIIIGISFLGTGTIIHQGGQQVEGLTTAASIFLTAGIGIAVAAECFVLGVGATVFGVTVLTGVGWVENRLGRRKRDRTSNEPEER